MRPRSVVTSRSHAEDRGGVTLTNIATPIVDSALPAAAGESVVPAPAAALDLADRGVESPDDTARIRAMLDEYRRAYERLDALSAAALWPGVDTRALVRAFGTLSRQSISFDRCDIQVTGSQATAQCDGAIEYVRRVGEAAPQSRGMSWSFELQQTAGRWRIVNVSAR
jgi:hypothetical protein